MLSTDKLNQLLDEHVPAPLRAVARPFISLPENPEELDEQLIEFARVLLNLRSDGQPVIALVLVAGELLGDEHHGVLAPAGGSADIPGSEPGPALESQGTAAAPAAATQGSQPAQSGDIPGSDPVASLDPVSAQPSEAEPAPSLVSEP